MNILNNKRILWVTFWLKIFDYLNYGENYLLRRLMHNNEIKKVVKINSNIKYLASVKR